MSGRPSTKKTISDAGLPDDPAAFKVLTEIDMIAHMAAVEFERLLPPTLTRAQFGVLHRLMRLNTEETIGELAAAFQVTQPTMSSTVKKLEEKGLIDFAPDPEDRRVKYVTVSAKGKSVRNQTINKLSPMIAAFNANGGDIDWETLLPNLFRIRQWFEERR